MEVDSLEHYPECDDDIQSAGLVEERSDKKPEQFNNKDAEDFKYVNTQDIAGMVSDRAAPDVSTAPGHIKEEYTDPDDEQMLADEEKIRELMNEIEVRHGTTTLKTEEEINADPGTINTQDIAGMVSDRAAPDVSTAPGHIKEEYTDPDDEQMLADEEKIRELMNEIEVRHGTTTLKTEEEINADPGTINTQDIAGMVSDRAAPDVSTAPGYIKEEHTDPEDTQTLADEEKIRELINEIEVRHGTTTLKTEEDINADTGTINTEDYLDIKDGIISEWNRAAPGVPAAPGLIKEEHTDTDDAEMLADGDKIRELINKIEVRPGTTSLKIEEEINADYGIIAKTNDVGVVGITTNEVWGASLRSSTTTSDGARKINIDASCIQNKETDEMLTLHALKESCNKVNNTAATYSILNQQSITNKRAIRQNKEKKNFTKIIIKTDFAIKNVVSNFICDNCQRNFVTKQKLRLHMSIHNRLSKSSLTCQTCNYKCTTIHALEKHSGLHDAKRPFKCNSCTYRFSLNKQLKKHVLTHITGYKRFQCGKCDYTCIKNSHLKEHKRTHTGVKPFRCDTCNYTCSRSSRLKEHKRIHTGDKPFQCDTCSYTCLSSSNLNKHKRKHAGHAPFQCNTCNYICSHSNSMKLHERKHTGDEPFQCDTCNYFCRSSSDFIRHKRTHTGDKPFQCDTCNYSCSQSGNMKVHKRTHTGDKPFQCDTCNYSCSQSSSLKVHKRTHTGDKPFQCDICKYTCSKSSNLKDHKRAHTGDKPFQCDTCNYICRSSSRLKEHKRKHTGDKPFHCDTCNYICSNSSNLKKHMRIHTGDKPFQCDTCSYVCNQSGHLKVHKRIHTGNKPFQCDTCNFSCIQSNNLKLHKRTHTGDKAFQCDTCNFTCIQSSTLKRHKMTHTGDKPFHCNTCNYTCRDSHDLRRHKTVHTGDKPFQCDTCGFRSSQKNNLKAHIIRTHTDEKPPTCDFMTSSLINFKVPIGEHERYAM